MSQATLSLGLATISATFYLLLFLGSCNSVHCRSTVAFGGAASTALSCGAGFGLLHFFDYNRSMIQIWLPLVMMFIGVQHIFEICQEVDRTSFQKTAKERVREAIFNAGPPITIQTLTTSLAFVFGSFSSLEAISSFCIFAAICTLMLYLCNMTFFLALVVWDTRRVEARKKDCFGACSCSEDSKWCCGGIFISKYQREFLQSE